MWDQTGRDSETEPRVLSYEDSRGRPVDRGHSPTVTALARSEALRNIDLDTHTYTQFVVICVYFASVTHTLCGQ